MLGTSGASGVNVIVRPLTANVPASGAAPAVSCTVDVPSDPGSAGSSKRTTIGDASATSVALSVGVNERTEGPVTSASVAKVQAGNNASEKPFASRAAEVKRTLTFVDAGSGYVGKMSTFESCAFNVPPRHVAKPSTLSWTLPEHGPSTGWSESVAGTIASLSIVETLAYCDTPVAPLAGDAPMTAAPVVVVNVVTNGDVITLPATSRTPFTVSV